MSGLNQFARLLADITAMPLRDQAYIVREIGLSIAGDANATTADRMTGQAIADYANDIEESCRSEPLPDMCEDAADRRAYQEWAR